MLQVRQGRAGLHRASARQGAKRKVHGARPGPLARLGHGRGEEEPRRRKKPRQGRAGRGRARGRLRAAFGVALDVQRLQASPLPLLQEVQVRVLGRSRPSACRRALVRGPQGGRQEGVRLRARYGGDQIRRGPGPLARPDSGRSHVRVPRASLDDLPLDRQRLRRHVERRAAPRGRLQAQEGAHRGEAHLPRPRALLQGVLGPPRG